MGHIIPKGKKYIEAQYFKECNKNKLRRGYVKFELLQTPVYILPELFFIHV